MKKKIFLFLFIIRKSFWYTYNKSKGEGMYYKIIIFQLDGCETALFCLTTQQALSAFVAVKTGCLIRTEQTTYRIECYNSASCPVWLTNGEHGGGISNKTGSDHRWRSGRTHRGRSIKPAQYPGRSVWCDALCGT